MSGRKYSRFVAKISKGAAPNFILFIDALGAFRLALDLGVKGVERLVREGLKKLGWMEADLARRKKGDPDKLNLAMKLRNETTMTIKWIAARLQMGTWTYLNHLLYLQRK